MSDAKQRLLAHLDLQDEVGAFSDEAFERLAVLVEDIRRENVYPAPLDTLDKVFGRWDTTFAHFGGKHSAGKPKVHDSDLKLQSFNRFPAVPIRVTRLCQEISATGNAYNNVIDFTCTDGKTQGVLIVHGRFRPDPDNRQRFHVEFHCTELRPAAGGDEAGLRKALGFDAEQSLKVDLKPPRLHSDVVYLDDEIRINIGGLGGLYLLRRSSDAPVSI
jgi:hypothetical protein